MKEYGPNTQSEASSLTEKARTASIQLLPPQLANQIAAGEVVERPASVVKELIENSIDANANSIHVEIEQGGQKRILIRDTGDGIAHEQLKLALSRHATSKIKNIDDLSLIHSMGFRGEALASISSVSRLTLCSKPETQAQAWQAKAEGIDMDVVLSPSAHPKGTSIEVLDLFFNTPARRKFLRAQKTEFQHIENIVKRISLAHPSISFVLKHNGKLVHKWASSSTEARIAAVCGKDFLAKTTIANYKHEDIQLHGWLSKIGEGWPNNERQYIFVNQRMIRDKLILHAIRQAYEGMLPDSEYPAYVLFLEIPPEQLDINVHPAKHEVRFHQARQVHDLIFQAISQAVLNAQHQTESSLSNSVSQMVPEENINHGYISPLRNAQTFSSELQNSGSKVDDFTNDARRHSIGSKESKTGNKISETIHGNIRGSQPYEQNIAEAGKRYQQLMQTQSNTFQSEASQRFPSGAPTFLHLGAFLMFQSEGALLLVSQLELVSAILMQDIESSHTSQPLLMPVSIAKETKQDKDSHQRQVRLVQQLETLGCQVVVQNQKYILKQVPSATRAFPWTHIFARLLEQKDGCSSKQECVISLTQRYLELVTLNYKQLQALVSKLSIESLNEILKLKGKEVSEQDILTLFESN